MWMWMLKSLVSAATVTIRIDVVGVKGLTPRLEIRAKYDSMKSVRKLVNSKDSR